MFPMFVSTPTRWATAFPTATGGPAHLSHSNEASHWLASIAQVVGWLALVTVLVLGRRRRT